MKNEEHNEQVALVQYLDLLGLKYTAIVNSFFGNKNYGMVAKFKREGWRPGLPDVFIIIKKNNKSKPIFIEMKKQSIKPKRNGKGGVSDGQREWITALNYAGINSYVCYGFEEAKRVVDQELKEL